MPASRLFLVLKHSPTQAQAVREYIDSLQNKSSSNFHKWLTPEEFGARYGPSDQDLKTVTDWLASHGFTVNRVAKARNLIEFSGTAGSVQEAFHTSIHSYLSNGETHFSIATDPEIPAALAPIVAGVTKLNNFNPKRNIVPGKSARWNTEKKVRTVTSPGSIPTAIRPVCGSGRRGGHLQHTQPAAQSCLYRPTL
jgi:subtilase family serine protease